MDMRQGQDSEPLLDSSYDTASDVDSPDPPSYTTSMSAAMTDDVRHLLTPRPVATQLRTSYSDAEDELNNRSAAFMSHKELHGAKPGCCDFCCCCCNVDPGKRCCCFRTALRCSLISFGMLLFLAGGLVAAWFIVYGSAAAVIRPPPDTVDCRVPTSYVEPFSSYQGPVALGDERPGPPQGLRLTNVTADTISLRWNLTDDTDTFSIIGYEVQRDNWWISGRGNMKTIECANRTQDNYTSTTYLLPDSSYSFQVRSNSTNDLSGWSDQLNVTTSAYQGCGNRNDLQVFRDQFDNIKGTIQNCLLRAALDLERAVACMVALGLSDPCGRCWAQQGLCVLAQCMPACLAPNSNACLQCSLVTCIPECIVCSGVPEWLMLSLP